MNKQDKTSEEELSKMEIRTDKEFKAIIIQMINELRRRMNEHSKKFNKVLQDIKRTRDEE